MHEWEVGRALKASSGVSELFAAADSQCEYPCRTPKTDASQAARQLFGARCFAQACFVVKYIYDMFCDANMLTCSMA